MREVIHYLSNERYTQDNYPDGFMEVCPTDGRRAANDRGPGYCYLSMDHAIPLWASACRHIHDKVIESPSK